MKQALANVLLPQHTALVQPTSVARTEQSKQTVITALAEIDELKQMLRYNEVSLAKAQEEKEKLTKTIDQHESDLEVSFER